MNLSTLRRTAQENGYRIRKAFNGGYTLIDERRNAVMFHFDGVPIEEIAGFFAPDRPVLAAADRQ